MKNSQIAGQIFVYLLGIVLVGFLLVYGYKAIQGFREKSDQAVFIKFKSDIVNEIKSSMEYGTVKRESFMLAEHFNEVCFLDLNAQQHIGIEKYPIIRNSLESGATNNIFMIAKYVEDSFHSGKIKATDGFLCIPVKNGQLKVQFEGKGDHTIISSYQR